MTFINKYLILDISFDEIVPTLIVERWSYGNGNDNYQNFLLTLFHPTKKICSEACRNFYISNVYVSLSLNTRKRELSVNQCQGSNKKTCPADDFGGRVHVLSEVDMQDG